MKSIMGCCRERRALKRQPFSLRVGCGSLLICTKGEVTRTYDHAWALLILLLLHAVSTNFERGSWQTIHLLLLRLSFVTIVWLWCYIITPCHCLVTISYLRHEWGHWCHNFWINNIIAAGLTVGHLLRELTRRFAWLTSITRIFVTVSWLRLLQFRDSVLIILWALDCSLVRYYLLLFAFFRFFLACHYKHELRWVKVVVNLSKQSVCLSFARLILLFSRLLERWLGRVNYKAF
jgi:hypothetical protein